MPLVAGAFLAPVIMAAAGYGLAGFVALTGTCVLLVIAGGELVLQRNYGSPEAPRTWPRQPVNAALLTTAVLALLVFLAALAVTAAGRALLAEDPGWVPVALLTAGTCVAALPAFLRARSRQGIRDAPRGLDAALRAITVHRIVRTLAATLTAQAGVLLLTQTKPGRRCSGRTRSATPSIRPPDRGGPRPWPALSWPPAAVVIAVIPVGGLARKTPAPLPRKEPAA